MNLYRTLREHPKCSGIAPVVGEILHAHRTGSPQHHQADLCEFVELLHASVGNAVGGPLLDCSWTLAQSSMQLGRGAGSEIHPGIHVKQIWHHQYRSMCSAKAWISTSTKMMHVAAHIFMQPGWTVVLSASNRRHSMAKAGLLSPCRYYSQCGLCRGRKLAPCCNRCRMRFCACRAAASGTAVVHAVRAAWSKCIGKAFCRWQS
jgi:hypothetical protein